MKNVGFSTGAISLGDFEQAIQLLQDFPGDAIELSALRVNEIKPLMEALPYIDLSKYEHISIHVPSSFSAKEEIAIGELLWNLPPSWLLILHPDTIHDFSVWHRFAQRIAIENMDRRKPRGRTAEELQRCFDELPEARLCFDIGHARQFDPSMAEAYLILSQFSNRLAQVHVSEVDSQSRHAVITYAAELAFREVARMIPTAIPLILESRVLPEQIPAEMQRAFELFRPSRVAN
jgi:hypothetical protein